MGNLVALAMAGLIIQATAANTINSTSEVGDAPPDSIPSPHAQLHLQHPLLRAVAFLVFPQPICRGGDHADWHHPGYFARPTSGSSR